MGMKTNHHYTIMDYVAKIKSKGMDYLLLPYWKLRVGKLGKKSRIKRGVRIVGNGKRIRIGDNFKVWHRSLFTVGTGKITIGNDGHIGVDTYLNASEGEIIIKNNVQIGSKVHMYSYSFGLTKVDDGTDSTYFGKPENIVIHDDVVVSSGAIILSGITIHKGAIIGAGAVVTKDVPANAVVGGVPAKVLRRRD